MCCLFVFFKSLLFHLVLCVFLYKDKCKYRERETVKVFCKAIYGIEGELCGRLRIIYK